MEFTDSNRKDLFNDLTEIEFVKGSLNKKYKYKAYIPRDIWNKWRPDSPLIRAEFKTVKFGRAGYMHYKDLIGEWKDYNHNDKKRRELYKKRHEPIMITRILDGKTITNHSYLVPFTNEFFSYWLMW